MSDLKLKPCPFCGGKAVVTVERGKKYKAVFVGCENCGASVPIIENKVISHLRANGYYDTAGERAIAFFCNDIAEKWNRRI